MCRFCGMSPPARRGGSVNEASVRRDLMQMIRRVLSPAAVALRHEDLYTRGIPDLSITVNGKTSWWEIKYADPSYRKDAVQQHICQKLEEQGYWRYVIYHWASPRCIRVVRPTQIDQWRTGGDVIPEFNHRAMVRYISEVHGCV